MSWLHRGLDLLCKDMTKCEKKILPEFNKMVIFSTTDFSYHGNPDKINCPNDNSRKSIAMYYYSNGRPASERKLGLHSTIFLNTYKVWGRLFLFEFKKRKNC